MIIAINNAMNAPVNLQRFHVGKQAFEKIRTEATLLRLIELKSMNKVVLDLVENLDRHEVRSRIRFSAAAQSENFASPVWICCSLSSSSCFCQSVTGSCFSFRHKSSQSTSNALSFSSTVIRSNGNTVSITLLCVIQAEPSTPLSRAIALAETDQLSTRRCAL